MKHLNGKYYVRAKDKRHIIHPNEDIIKRERKPAKSLKTQYEVPNETKIGKNQKGIKNQSDE